jgi:hypothetical protein
LDDYTVDRKIMFEYGLSVSLNGTPRSDSPSPVRSSSPLQSSSSFRTPSPLRHRVPQAPNCPRKIRKFNVVPNDDEGSVSPRVLFAPPIPDVVRRLEPSFSDLSPVSFGSVSAAAAAVVPGQCGDDDSVGECAICYQHLPSRANHVFTMCGHLYCVRCLLKWWDSSTTCPVCRSELFTDTDAEADADADADTDAEAEADAEADYESDTTTDDDDDDDVTLMDRYLHQDMFFENSYHTRRFYDGNGGDSDSDSDSDNDSVSSDDDIRANYDDTIRTGRYSLTHSEFRHLRQSRKFAMNLYGRMVFREMLLSQEVEFRGDVRYCDDSVIPKSDWSQILTTLAHQQYSDTVNIIMFEFVIRRGGSISPTNEVNLFGFIKEVRIIQPGFFDNAAWDNLHEYAFLADVFTYSCDYSRSLGHTFIEYGSYDMTEGTISPTELIIPFSEIRRLYRMRGIERIAYNAGGGGTWM